MSEPTTVAPDNGHANSPGAPSPQGAGASPPQGAAKASPQGATAPPPSPGAVIQPSRRKGLFLRFGAIILLVALGWLVYWWIFLSHIVSTDNAYTAVEIAQITPSVEGTVSEVLVADTQSVKAGDVLVRIDDRDTRLALLEECRTLPVGALWDFYCEQQGVPVGAEWLIAVKQYEQSVLAQRK